MLLRDAAKNHRPQPSVAERQRLRPIRGGLLEPYLKRLFRQAGKGLAYAPNRKQ